MYTWEIHNFKRYCRCYRYKLLYLGFLKQCTSHPYFNKAVSLSKKAHVEQEGNKNAIQSFEMANKVEQIHAELLQESNSCHKNQK
jgi:hypothetical protein